MKLIIDNTVEDISKEKAMKDSGSLSVIAESFDVEVSFIIDQTSGPCLSIEIEKTEVKQLISFLKTWLKNNPS